MLTVIRRILGSVLTSTNITNCWTNTKGYLTRQMGEEGVGKCLEKKEGLGKKDGLGKRGELEQEDSFIPLVLYLLVYICPSLKKKKVKSWYTMPIN